MKIGNKLMRKLGYVPYAEYEIVKKQGDKDSELCASLVEECQLQATTIDQLTEEREQLKMNHEVEKDILRRKLVEAGKTISLILADL